MYLICLAVRPKAFPLIKFVQNVYVYVPKDILRVHNVLFIDFCQSKMLLISNEILTNHFIIDLEH
jgi:hypothetical protein